MTKCSLTEDLQQLKEERDALFATCVDVLTHLVDLTKLTGHLDNGNHDLSECATSEVNVGNILHSAFQRNLHGKPSLGVLADEISREALRKMLEEAFDFKIIDKAPT